jgi:hypothetical protein
MTYDDYAWEGEYMRLFELVDFLIDEERFFLFDDSKLFLLEVPIFECLLWIWVPAAFDFEYEKLFLDWFIIEEVLLIGDSVHNGSP